MTSLYMYKDLFLAEFSAVWFFNVWLSELTYRIATVHSGYVYAAAVLTAQLLCNEWQLVDQFAVFFWMMLFV